MKKYLLFPLAICSINIMLGQDLIIELSVIWKNENVYLNKNIVKQSHSHIPYLKITYRNFVEEDIYFKDSFGDDNTVYHKMGVNALHSPTIEELNLINFFKRLEEDKETRLQENYIVDISNCHFKNISPCLTFFEKKYEGKEREIGVGIDYDLYYLTRLLYIQEQLNKNYLKKQIPLFNYPDKSMVTLENAHKLLKKIEKKNTCTDFTAWDINFAGLKDHFIFLKKGEVYEREINLLPLLLLGGKYHFKFATLKMYNAVHGAFNSVKEPSYPEFVLPEELEGYRLYNKAFISNEVYVDFSNIR